MVTLDTLTTHYGAPFFIKIDVEGFEESVLNGLSIQPPLLSFEFNCAYPQATLRCLDNPVFNDRSLFNFAIADPTNFELSSWVEKDQLKEALGSIKQGYGDVFVKARPF